MELRQELGTGETRRWDGVGGAGESVWMGIGAGRFGEGDGMHLESRTGVGPSLGLARGLGWGRAGDGTENGYGVENGCGCGPGAGLGQVWV